MTSFYSERKSTGQRRMDSIESTKRAEEIKAFQIVISMVIYILYLSILKNIYVKKRNIKGYF